MDQIATQMPSTSTATTSVAVPHHSSCLTLDVTKFLLGRVSMDDVGRYCVLTALAPLRHGIACGDTQAADVVGCIASQPQASRRRQSQCGHDHS